MQWRRVKIAHIAEFTTSRFFTFNDFFHFPGLNWSLQSVKHIILILQRQLIFNKYLSIYTHFAVAVKGLKKCIFLSWHCAKFPLLLNKRSFQTNKVNVQKRGNIKRCCDLRDFMSTADWRNIPIFCYNYLQYPKSNLEASLTNTIIHYMYHVFVTFNSMKQHS